MCSSRKGNYDNRCVCLTAVGNIEQTTFSFVNVAVDKLVTFRPVCPQKNSVVCGGEWPVLTHNGVWGSAALFGK